MKSPRVSIVMSVFNGERHLPRAVESVLQQTFQDFEFLVVNDGSTDGSREILEEFAGQDRRLRIIDQSNAGLTAALRTGCQAATGEFIARQDADDWSAPQRLETLVLLIGANPAVVMAGTWAAHVDDDGQVVDRFQPAVDPATATRRLLDEHIGPPAHGAMMFPRRAYEQVGGYRLPFYYAQDTDLWFRLGSLGCISYAPAELYHARVSPTGISGARTDWQWKFGDLAQQCHRARRRGESDAPIVTEAERLRQELLSQRPAEAVTRRQQSATHYRIGTCLSRRGNPSARRHFWSTVRLNPWHWRGWCRLGFEMIRRPFITARANGAEELSNDR